MKVSKETQVGALTAIAITILVLGYNYLSGRDDIFNTGKKYHAVYTNVDGLTGSRPVMFSGVKIGSVESINLDVNTLKTHVILDITKTDFRMPKNSIARIVDDGLLGGKLVQIELGDSKEQSQSGDTLIAANSIGLANSVTGVLEPLATKLNRILGSLDTLTGNGQLEASLKELPSTIVALKTTLNTANNTIAGAGPKLNQMLTNANSLIAALSDNKESIANALGNLEKMTDDLAKANLKETVANASLALAEFAKTLDGVNKGEGTLGKLVKDETLYNNLNKASLDLDKLLLDFKRHPDKYIAIPFTKKRQKKGMENSKNDPEVN